MQGYEPSLSPTTTASKWQARAALSEARAPSLMQMRGVADLLRWARAGSERDPRFLVTRSAGGSAVWGVAMPTGTAGKGRVRGRPFGVVPGRSRACRASAAVGRGVAGGLSACCCCFHASWAQPGRVRRRSVSACRWCVLVGCLLS